MKARVKATGEIVEIECVGTSNKYHYEVYKVEDLDFENLDTPDYWTRLEHRYAGMAMQGLMSYVEQITPKKGRSYCDEIVGISFKVAHALVEKMKEEREG